MILMVYYEVELILLTLNCWGAVWTQIVRAILLLLVGYKGAEIKGKSEKATSVRLSNMHEGDIIDIEEAKDLTPKR